MDYRRKDRNRIKRIVDEYMLSSKEIRQKMFSFWGKMVSAIRLFVSIDQTMSELNLKIETSSRFLNEKINQFTVDISNIKSVYEQDILKFSNIVRTLESKNNELKGQISYLLERAKELDEKQSISKIETEESLPNIFTYDSLCFNPDGFIIEDFEKRNANGIFVIEQISDNEAKLRFNPDENVQSRKIGSMEVVLKRICEDYEPVWNPTYIITETPGILTKIDNIWVITQKMKIKLINNENDDF